MVANRHPLVLGWMLLGTSLLSEGRRGDSDGDRHQHNHHSHHPLCRALTSGEQQRPTRFPSAYVCYGDEEEDPTCSPREEEPPGEPPGASLRKAGMKKAPAKATWWVYEDRRKHVSRHPGNFSPDTWIDCDGYYAFRGVVENAGDDGGVALSYFPAEMIKKTRADEALAEAPSTATKRSRSLRSSEEMNTLTTAFEEDARSAKTVKASRRKLDLTRNGFVYAPNDVCQEFWLLWPGVQEKAFADGTVLIYDVFPSVGNLFLVLEDLIKFVRLLELGLVLKWEKFPGFREAFDPADLNWAVDPAPFVQRLADIKRGINPAGLHALEFGDYSMVLGDPQLELLASSLGVTDPSKEAVTASFQAGFPNRLVEFMAEVMHGPLSTYEALAVRPCAWNMLLRRSATVMASLEEHSPWGMVMGDAGLHHHPTEYAAWHIRTSEGETAESFDPNIHPHVLQEPASAVCPAFLAAMDDVVQATHSCREPHDFGADMVYISSNSKAMSSECTVEAASHGIVTGHIDLGLRAGDVHTSFSTNPSLAALSAFLDYLFLMDAAAIVRTSSSFSGTVATIKRLDCRLHTYETLPGRELYLCLPSDCSA